MRNDCFSRLINLYGFKEQGAVSPENQDQYYSMIMMFQLLFTSPCDSIDPPLNLLYILDIFWDFDQSSEGEQRLLEGQKIFQETYFAKCGIPTFNLDRETASKLMPGGQGVTESAQPIMQATYMGITGAPVLLFDLLENRKSLRSVYYYMVQWMVKNDLNGKVLANALRESILQQNEDKGTSMNLRELDNNPETIGQRKLHQLIFIDLLSVILSPILAVTRYNMTARPVTDFPLFFFYNDSNANEEYLFTSISDIKESSVLEATMVPSSILSRELTGLFTEYKNSFTFAPYSYHCPDFRGSHRLRNVSNKTFGYLIFDLIEKAVTILDAKEIDVSRSVVIGIIEYLMEFPSIFSEYASLYGWRQDPNLYSTIYMDIIRKYCQTVMTTGQKLLDLCFMTVFFSSQMDSSDDMDIEPLDDADDELALSQSAQELSSKLLEEDEQYFMSFFSKLVDLVTQHSKLEVGFLAALGMNSLTSNDLLYQSLSLALANGCSTGSVKSPLDISSEPYYYMHSDVIYLFLTGLEYAVFLLQATSDHIPSVGPEDHERYREMYLFLEKGDVLQIIGNAFGIQTETETFMALLRNILDNLISAKDNGKACYVHSVILSFFSSAIKEIDAIHYRRTEHHMLVTEQLLEQPAHSLQFTTSIISQSKSQGAALVFTTSPVDVKTVAKTTPDPNQTVLDVFANKTDFLSNVLKKFLKDNPSSIDKLWPESEYSKQVALFESKYDILYRTLQDICLYSSQTYQGMASVMETYKLPAYPQLETRRSMIRRSYIGGLYRNSLEWHLAQLVRNYIMIPDVRSSLTLVTKMAIVSTGVLALQIDNTQTDLSIPSLQELAKCHGICSPSRYGLALFFAKEEDGSLMLTAAHSIFYLTDSILMALLTDQDAEFISSRTDTLTVFASPTECAVSHSLFGDFVPDTGSAQMVCNGRSYHNLDKCKFCRIQEAIYHGRDKAQNNIKDTRQLMTPIVDFHNVLLTRLVREDNNQSIYQFKSAVLDKLCSPSRVPASVTESSDQLFISNKSSDNNTVIFSVSADGRVCDNSELEELKLNKFVSSIYSEKRYLRICLRGGGVADLSQILCQCVLKSVFKDGKATFSGCALDASLKTIFERCVASQELSLTSDTVPPSLWVLADSPNFFVVHYNELSYEILRMAEQLGAKLACITDVFDGIGSREHFLIKAFHAILLLLDPKFGKLLLEKLNEKIIMTDVREKKQTTTGRLVDGTWRLIKLIEETEKEEYADKKPSETTLKLALQLKANLNYLITTLKPFVSQVIARIPIKFMTVGQFNELGCPSTLDDLIVIVKSEDCNINDTRRLLPRSIHTVELLLDER